MNKFYKLSIFAVLASLLLSSFRPVVAASVKNIEIDEDEYGLYVDADFNAYGKFTSSPADDPDSYTLWFDSDVGSERFEPAAVKAGFDSDEYLYVPWYATLIDENEKEVKSGKLDVFIPIPDDVMENPEDCSFYKVSGKDGLTPIPLDLYNYDDIIYTRFKFSATSDYDSTYAFVYKDPFYEPEDEDEEGEEDEDEDEEEEETVSPTPTPEPTKAPTPTPKPTPAPTKAPEPTKAPSKDQTGSNTTSSGNSGVKDTIPKTGDDYPLGTIVTIAAASTLILIFAVSKYKK